MRCAKILAILACLGSTVALAGEVRLIVEEPSGVPRQQWPVTSGIPLAQGALQDDQTAALFDAAGSQVPLQTEVLVRWPDGSIRWLLLDFLLDLGPREKKSLTLGYGPQVRRQPVDKPVKAQRGADDKVTIHTGPLRLEYYSKLFFPQGAAWLTSEAGLPSEKRVTINCLADGIVLKDAQNQSFLPFGPTEMIVEQAGPIRACLRVRGWHTKEDSRTFQYIARIHAWRGQPWIRVCYTFINDQQDSLMTSIRGLQMRFWCPSMPRTCLLDGQPVEKGRLFQVDDTRYLLDDKPTGKRARGWAAIGGNSTGVAVGLRDFWQNWPKAINCREGRIGLELLPELPADLYRGKPLEEENKLYYAVRDGLYTFKVGVAKTHEFWVRYFTGQPDAKRLGDFFEAANEPLMAVAEPAHVSSTRALGDFPPADSTKYSGYDAWLDRSLEAHLRQREKVREYGLLNYGDWYGERKVNWGNLEYDLAHGMLVQYLRTGDRRFFLRGEQAARHHIDVDVVHAVNPHLKNPWGPPPRVGDIWLHCLNHTGGYYDKAPLPVDRTYQMGHSTNFGHVWVGGDFEYYFLTGDRRAREVALEIADAMVSHCPTAYGDHIRGLGWPIVLVLNAYEATGDRKYLDAAKSCWEVLKKNIDWQKGWVVRLARGHCLHPERTCYGNVPFMEGLTLSGLARYHRLTCDPEVLKALTVGIDQMIRECWLEKDKSFRYTPCPLTNLSPHSMFLASEAMAYEGRLTGNKEHLRILREGMKEVLRRSGSGDGKGQAQLIHFAPFALKALEKE